MVVIGTEAETPELVLPAGASVQFDLTSRDVIHSFFIPGFRFKRDMFPGEVQSFQVDVGERTGIVARRRRVRRVLRARPPQDALRRAHRHARRVRRVGACASMTQPIAAHADLVAVDELPERTDRASAACPRTRRSSPG